MIRFDIDPPRTGDANMLEDTRRALEALDGSQTPRVRLYTWRPWCVSLGYHQSDDLLDMEALSGAGVGATRRPTGGGAILHAEELTYAVTMPLGDRRPLQVYDMIAASIVQGLSFLGLEADVEAGMAGQYVASVACFSGIARSEIRVKGKKLVGSAQRVYRSRDGRSAVLQHGSILLGDAHTALPRYMAGASLHDRHVQSLDLRERSTHLAAELGRRFTFAEVVESMQTGFEEILGRRIEEDEMEAVS